MHAGPHRATPRWTRCGWISGEASRYTSSTWIRSTPRASEGEFGRHIAVFHPRPDSLS